MSKSDYPTIYKMIEEASPRDKILQYLKSSRKGDIMLTEVELRYIERLDYADDIIRAHPALRDKELVNMILTKFGDEFSSSTAYNLRLDARYIHGSMAKTVRSYERNRITQCAWELFDKARNDNKVSIALDALDLIAKINNLDNFDLDDNEAEEQTKGPVIIRPAFAPETLGVELPENIEELILQMRSKAKKIKNAIENTGT